MYKNGLFIEGDSVTDRLTVVNAGDADRPREEIIYFVPRLTSVIPSRHRTEDNRYSKRVSVPSFLHHRWSSQRSTRRDVLTGFLREEGAIPGNLLRNSETPIGAEVASAVWRNKRETAKRRNTLPETDGPTPATQSARYIQRVENRIYVIPASF